MGVTLTQRIGEFLHVLVQVLMKAGQLSGVPAGCCFKQPVDVERPAVPLVVGLRLASDRSLKWQMCHRQQGYKKMMWVKRSSSRIQSTLQGLENTQQPWYNGCYRRQRAVCLCMGRLTCQSGD